MLYSVNLAKKEVFHSDYLDEDIIDLLGGTFQVPDQFQCDVVPVEPGYEARMDLIAQEVYGDDLYADTLSRLNGPANPFEITDDLYLMLPSYENLSDFNVNPSESWSEAKITKSAKRPKPKTKNEKRKPNQAIVGSKRFNIDAQSKIIVY